MRYGVNHIDVAAGYGDAELRIAPWREARRPARWRGLVCPERRFQGRRGGYKIRCVYAGARTAAQDLRYLQLHFLHQERRQAAGEADSQLQPFVDQMDTARARSQDGGAKYPEISLAIRTAIQKALTGEASAEAALKEAAAKIKETLAKK